MRFMTSKPYPDIPKRRWRYFHLWTIEVDFLQQMRSDLMKWVLIIGLIFISRYAIATTLTVAPNSYDFGRVPVGHSSKGQAFTISNVDSRVIRLGLVEIVTTMIDAVGNQTTAQSEEFILSDDPCSNTEINSGKNCRVTVTFRPITLGVKSANLIVRTVDSSIPVVDVPLSGNSTDDPNIEANLKSYNFKKILVGNSSRTQLIRIFNTGINDLEIGKINLTGDNNEFTFQDNCSDLKITQFSNCTLSVAFEPHSEGAKIATIFIPSNDPDTPILEITLKGGSNVIAKVPSIKVEPLFDNFGEVQVGSTSVYKLFTISNEGNGTLKLGEITLLGEDFTSMEDLCSNQKIKPSGRCFINIRFEPKSVGIKVGTLSVSSDDPNAPIVEVALQGTGLMSCTNFEFSVYPSPMDFGTELVGNSRTLYQSVSLNARGCVSAIMIEDIKITGTDAPEFTFNNNSCYHNLYGNTFYSNCNFYTTFTPTSAGTKSAELIIIFNDTSQRTVPLVAKALTTGQANLETSPSNIDFGAVTMGLSQYQNFTIKNTGNVNLTINSINVTGQDSADFYVYGCYYYDYGYDNRVLYPSQECQVYGYFQPTLAGNKQANLTVASNLLTKDIPITGRATEPADCSAENITIESLANGPWANKATDNYSYNQPSDAWKRLKDFNEGESSTPNYPRAGDVVLIKAGHQITGIPYASVRALCIEEGGILESLDNRGTELNISADDYIENRGIIQGKDGAAEASDATSCSTNYWSSVGMENCAQYGASISLNVQSYQGLVLNKGTILAGHGGDGKQFGAAGGSININAAGITNTVDIGIIDAGRGGNITGTQSGQAGQGGAISIWGNNYLKSDGRRILAGNGGNCNPEATESQTGGNGGDFWFNANTVDLLDGTTAAGQGGKNCGTNGRDGTSGNFWMEPNVITLSGAQTKVSGGNVTIFGGNDWLLNLGHLSEGAITASGNITIAVGKGGVIDFRGSTGKIMKAAGQVILFANDILLDEGVKLADLIDATNIVVGPSKILYQVFLMGPNKVSGIPDEPVSIRLPIANGGPQADTYLLSVTDSADWELSDLPTTVKLEGLETTELELSVNVPAGLGGSDVITITAISQTDPGVIATTSVQVVAEIDGSVTPPIQSLSTCAANDIIDWVCRNNREQVLTNVTIGSNGNVAGGILAGNITNRGIISQVKVQSGASVNGGKLTGYINNEGTLANFEFVGAEISGGTLAGTVSNNSQVDGTFKDVHLAADAHIIGGYLQGNIIGDMNAPALLENVTIKSDSFLSGVKLGEGVMLEAKTTCGDGVQAEPGVCPSDIELPSLRATATNAQGENVGTAAIFSGGISVNQVPFETQATLTIADLVDILGQIQVDPLDLGQAAELVVYVSYKPLAARFSDPPVYFMLNENGDILPWNKDTNNWDEDVKNLVPFQTVDALAAYLPVPMYQGPLPATGYLKIFFGYRLVTGGTVIQNLEPIEVTITE
jgi:hypothetical protein